MPLSSDKRPAAAHTNLRKRVRPRNPASRGVALLCCGCDPITPRVDDRKRLGHAFNLRRGTDNRTVRPGRGGRFHWALDVSGSGFQRGKLNVVLGDVRLLPTHCRILPSSAQCRLGTARCQCKSMSTKSKDPLVWKVEPKTMNVPANTGRGSRSASR